MSNKKEELLVIHKRTQKEVMMWQKAEDTVLKVYGIKINKDNKPPFPGDSAGQVYKWIKCYDNKRVSFLKKDEETGHPYWAGRTIKQAIYGYWYWNGIDWVEKLPTTHGIRASSVEEFVAKGGKVNRYKEKA